MNDLQESGLTYRDIGEALEVNHARLFKIAKGGLEDGDDLEIRAQRWKARAADYEKRARRLNAAAERDLEELEDRRVEEDSAMGNVGASVGPKPPEQESAPNSTVIHV